MNTLFGRFSRIAVIILTFTFVVSSRVPARPMDDKKPKPRVGSITDSLEITLRSLNQTLKRLDTEWSREWKQALKNSKEAADRVKRASDSEYDGAMADLNKALKDMEFALNSPNGSSVRNSLREMDTEMQRMKEENPNFHLDSMTFGPYHTPHVRIPSFSIPEYDIHIPDIDIPEIHIPSIHVPGIDVPSLKDDTGDSDVGAVNSQVSVGSGALDFAENGFDVSPLEHLGSLNSNGILNSDVLHGYTDAQSFLTPSLVADADNNRPRVTSEYYTDGHTRYFIHNSEVDAPIELNGPVTIWPKP